jgi:hypothetical protein
MDVTQTGTSRKYALEFNAAAVGSCDISFKNKAMVYDEDGNEMSVSHNVLTVNVKAAYTASTNAYLKTLEISPKGLEPDFDRNVYEYSLNVGNDIGNLIITADPEDEKAKVSISGNDFLKEGENKVIVTVLAESGDIIEYTINVNREAAPDASQTPDETTDGGSSAGNILNIVQQDGATYIVYSGRYKLIEPDSSVTIPDGYTKTQLIISDVTVTAYSPDDLDSDFLLIYAENESGQASFYQYDRVEKTIQRYSSVNAGVNGGADQSSSKDIMNSKEYRSNLNKAAVVIAVLSIVCLLLGFVVFRLYMKQKGRRKDDFD